MSWRAVIGASSKGCAYSQHGLGEQCACCVPEHRCHEETALPSRRRLRDVSEAWRTLEQSRAAVRPRDCAWVGSRPTTSPPACAALIAALPVPQGDIKRPLILADAHA